MREGTMAAGYSGTPLAKKLGLKEDCKVLLVGAPDSYIKLLGPLPGACSSCHVFQATRTSCISSLNTKLGTREDIFQFDFAIESEKGEASQPDSGRPKNFVMPFEFAEATLKFFDP